MVKRCELLEVALGEGGAQGRHGRMDALLVQLQHVEIPLHHQGAVPQLPLGPVEAEEDLALVEEGRFPGVQVLGFVIAEGPAAEGDETPPGIVDGDGEPVAQEIDEAAPLAPGGQPRLLDEVVGEALLPQVVHQLFPGIRGKAEAGLLQESLRKSHAALR